MGISEAERRESDAIARSGRFRGTVAVLREFFKRRRSRRTPEERVTDAMSSVPGRQIAELLESTGELSHDDARRLSRSSMKRATHRELDSIGDDDEWTPPITKRQVCVVLRWCYHPDNEPHHPRFFDPVDSRMFKREFVSAGVEVFEESRERVQVNLTQLRRRFQLSDEDLALLRRPLSSDEIKAIQV